MKTLSQSYVDIPRYDDPCWAELTIRLQSFLAGGYRSWEDLTSWAQAEKWDLHFTRNAVAWLEGQGLAAWYGSRGRWLAAEARPGNTSCAAPHATPIVAATIYHHHCYACRRSYFSEHRDRGLCEPCRPAGCALCGAALSPDPPPFHGLVFCSARHRDRVAGPAPRRPHKHRCVTCGQPFWGARHAQHCCSAHRDRHRQAAGAAAPPPAGRRRPPLTDLELLVAEDLRDQGLTAAEAALALGVGRTTYLRARARAFA